MVDGERARENGVMSRDSGDAAVWVMIAMPLIMILCLVLIGVLWAKTCPIVALLALLRGSCGGRKMAAALSRILRSLATAIALPLARLLLPSLVVACAHTRSERRGT
jgi:hypothetical protein